MRKVTTAVTQMSCSWDREKTLSTAEHLVKSAAEKGANIVLLQELFETPIDATGEILGVYRKTHIPDGMPYAEKFYFTPGDSGFKDRRPEMYQILTTHGR